MNIEQDVWKFSYSKLFNIKFYFHCLPSKRGKGSCLHRDLLGAVTRGEEGGETSSSHRIPVKGRGLFSGASLWGDYFEEEFSIDWRGLSS